MTETGSPTLRCFPAPFISATDTLITSTTPGSDTLLYRCGEASFKKPPVDLFATGHFTLHQFPWPLNDEPDWKEMSQALQQLANRDVSLVGYLTYEAGLLHEQRWHKLKVPDTGYAWRFYEVPCWYEADHLLESGCIYAVPGCPDRAIDEIRNVLKVAMQSQCHSYTYNEMATLDEVARYGEMTEAGYCQTIEAILEDIKTGRYYELNFTQKFAVQSHVPPSLAFQRLFRRYQPRRAFYGTFSGEVVGSCSPEMFIKKQGQKLFSRPIKGSISRSTTDSQLEKLRAEHIMVVDLARNDVGRASDKSWVSVPELATENQFGGLKHLESLVTGESSLTWPEIISHVYPAASITGAPKVEVVKAISEYEMSPRQVYTGACGWIWPNEDLDFNVAIRTFVSQIDGDIWNYTLGAGGAIVADSDPAEEFEECLRKARPLISELLGHE